MDISPVLVVGSVVLVGFLVVVGSAVPVGFPEVLSPVLSHFTATWIGPKCIGRGSRRGPKSWSPWRSKPQPPPSSCPAKSSSGS